MAGSDFTVEGWDEFTLAFQALIDRWEQKKIGLLQHIGNIMEEEIKPLIPVDTSRLESSFSVTVGGSESVEYSTNVEYALYVNDGHVQHKRFLPVRYLSAGGRQKYIRYSGKKGIMLKERYVAGKHFIEDGMQNATPRIERLIVSWIEQAFREVMGSNL